MVNAASKTNPTNEASGEPHCAHCGRPVKETVHTRARYYVDYYELHAGQVEESTFRHGEDGPVQIYQRLVVPEVVITCADCYRDPMVQEVREHRFRPEAYQPAEEVSP